MSDTKRDPARTEDVEEGAWRQRCEALLASVGASEPDDHPWVEEARWLLDHFPEEVGDGG